MRKTVKVRDFFVRENVAECPSCKGESHRLGYVTSTRAYYPPDELGHVHDENVKHSKWQCGSCMMEFDSGYGIDYCPVCEFNWCVDRNVNLLWV